ncbi:MAG: dihydrolipoamide acetyltransferase family protein [Aeromicrobium erythreum]
MSENRFALPDVGEGLTEAEVVSWRVQVGDEVRINDVIVDIETAKSIVELPSPFAGTVTALLVAEGETVPVGTPIIAIGDPAAARSAAGGEVTTAAEVAAASEKPVEEERQAVLVGYGPRSTGVPQRRRPRNGALSAPPVEATPAPQPVPDDLAKNPEPVGSTPSEAPPRPARALAKPPVRKLAKDLGVDLADVPCAGAVVTRAEVEAHVASLRSGSAATTSVTASPSSPSPQAGERRVPVKGVRKMTAAAMVSSAFTAPHVTEWVTLDVSRTVELVDRLRADRRFADVKVSPTLLVARAVCLALRRTPELNARWDEQAQEIVYPAGVTLGIAAATDRGLVVPNIPGADAMSLVELAAALGELTATARAGRTQPAQMSGGTFTITNIGVFGVDAGTPILNPGESGILAVGQIDRRPWVDEHDQVVPRWVTTLALSFDHRVVDGEQGSRFLADVAAMLRDPALAMTY